jgi:hypothetical protein
MERKGIKNGGQVEYTGIQFDVKRVTGDYVLSCK